MHDNALIISFNASSLHAYHIIRFNCITTYTVKVSYHLIYKIPNYYYFSFYFFIFFIFNFHSKNDDQISTTIYSSVYCLFINFCGRSKGKKLGDDGKD